MAGPGSIRPFADEIALQPLAPANLMSIALSRYAPAHWRRACGRRWASSEESPSRLNRVRDWFTQLRAAWQWTPDDTHMYVRVLGAVALVGLPAAVVAAIQTDVDVRDAVRTHAPWLLVAIAVAVEVPDDCQPAAVAPGVQRGDWTELPPPPPPYPIALPADFVAISPPTAAGLPFRIAPTTHAAPATVVGGRWVTAQAGQWDWSVLLQHGSGSGTRSAPSFRVDPYAESNGVPADVRDQLAMLQRHAAVQFAASVAAADRDAAITPGTTIPVASLVVDTEAARAAAAAAELERAIRVAVASRDGGSACGKAPARAEGVASRPASTPSSEASSWWDWLTSAVAVVGFTRDGLAADATRSRGDTAGHAATLEAATALPLDSFLASDSVMWTLEEEDSLDGVNTDTGVRVLRSQAALQDARHRAAYIGKLQRWGVLS